MKPQLKQRNKMKNKNVGIGFEKVEKFELTEKEGILITAYTVIKMIWEYQINYFSFYPNFIYFILENKILNATKL